VGFVLAWLSAYGHAATQLSLFAWLLGVVLGLVVLGKHGEKGAASGLAFWGILANVFAFLAFAGMAVMMFTTQ